MNQSELITQIYKKNPELTRQQLANSVRLLHKSIIATLVKQGHVEFRGFGSFFLSRRSGRAVCNPRTNLHFHVPPRQVPRFKAGKRLKKSVNTGSSDRS